MVSSSFDTSPGLLWLILVFGHLDSIDAQVMAAQHRSGHVIPGRSATCGSSSAHSAWDRCCREAVACGETKEKL